MKKKVFGSRIIKFWIYTHRTMFDNCFFPRKTISHAPSFFSHPRLTVSWFCSIQRLTHRRFLGTESNKVCEYGKVIPPSIPPNPPPMKTFSLVMHSEWELTQANHSCAGKTREILSFFGNVDQSFLFFLIILSHQQTGWIILSIFVN